MMKLSKLIARAAACVAAASAIVFASGCTDDLQTDVDKLKGRVAELEAAVGELKTNFQSGLMITSVDPTEGGHTINFLRER